MKHKITTDTIIVGIPYLDSGAQGRELEYAIAGWHKHFKEDDFLVVVVGDHHPAVDLYDRTMHIPAPRVAPVEGEYLPAIDIINKMQVLRKAFPKHKGFVWTNDDIYAVNNFDLSDIKFLKMLEPTVRFSEADSNPWKACMARTRRVLTMCGYNARSFALHLPCWYEWDKALSIINEYDLRHKSLNFQGLYFNIYYGDRVPFRLNAEHDNIKCGVYSETPSLSDLQKALKSKIWINNSVTGYVPELVKVLEGHYGI